MHIAIATTVKMKSVPQPCRSSAVSATEITSKVPTERSACASGSGLSCLTAIDTNTATNAIAATTVTALATPLLWLLTASTSGIAMNTSQMNIRIRPTTVRGGSPRRASVSRLTIVSAERSRARERSRSLSVPAV